MKAKWTLLGSVRVEKGPNQGDDEGDDGVDVHHHSGDVDGNADGIHPKYLRNEYL